MGLLPSGVQMQVGVSTLLHSTPPGSYFRGLLRFHGLEDGSGRQELDQAMKR
jgi:hypothetical protein